MTTAAKNNGQEQQNRISGVFSSKEVRKVGTGTTTRKTIQKAFWYCDEQEDGSMVVQPLNANYIPSGPKKKVTREQFLELFSPEPELYVSSVYPQMRELNKTIARADRHRTNKEYFSAEMEYQSALKVDEENVRANFGLGITYLERGETSKADDIFERLVKLEAAFEAEHKHLFNEFGIKLRKNKMFDQSVAYYERALELAAQDENLQYNLARAYLEKEDYPKTLEFLLKSLDLNPLLEPAIKFLMWMVGKGLVPESEKPAVATALSKVKQAQAAAAAQADSAGQAVPAAQAAPAQVKNEAGSAPAPASAGGATS